MAPQNDFSSGELNADAKRSDDPLVKAGARQLSNWRILNSRKVTNRPGRTALFQADGRTDEVLVAPGVVYRLSFGNGTLVIRDASGAQVASQSGYAWTAATAKSIVWTKVNNSATQRDVVICFPGQKTKIARWTSPGTWSFLDFSFSAAAGGALSSPFYRLSPAGITLQPSAVTGTVNIVFSGDVLVTGHVGTRIRYQERQMTIATVVDARNGTATINEQLFPTQRVTLSTDPTAIFAVGDAVEGSVTSAAGVVATVGGNLTSVTAMAPVAAGTGYAVSDQVSVAGGSGTAATATVATVNGSGGITGLTVASGGSYTAPPTNPVTLTTVTGVGTGATADLTTTTTTNTLDVVLSSSRVITTSDTLVGPHGSGTVSAVLTISPAATTAWDDEVINDLRGWPNSCFFDQSRLGFCDIPSVPGGVAYSEIGIYNVFLTGANPSDPFFEIAPDSAHVYHVVSKGDEFFITDRGIYYSPVNANNPLKPGSLQFLKFSSDQASSVHPVQTSQAILFVNAGLTRVVAIVVNTHSLYVPWATQEVSLYHSHLIKTPVALAVTSDGSQMPEQYVYVVNSDGTMAVGKFDIGKDWAGFVPWSGQGFVNWVSSLGQQLIVTETYTSNNFGITLAEQVDTGQYLDGAVLLNNVPTNMRSLAVGDGPLWWLKNGTVDLIDGVRTLGTHQVDATGNVVKLDPNEDLSSTTIIAGKAWSAVLEPFIAHAAGGQNEGQRVKRRKVKRAAVSVESSTGFIMSAVTPVSCNRRIPAYMAGDDQNAQPPLRETTYSFRTRGRAYDPRVILTKDLPGPLTVSEVGFEVTV